MEYTGDDALALFDSPAVANIFRPTTFDRADGEKFTYGDIMVVADLKNYIKTRRKIFHHTQKLRPICVHEQVEVARLIGTAMRLEAIVFPSKPPPPGSHDYIHVLHRYVRGQDHIASGKYTEHSHQFLRQCEESAKRIPGEEKKAFHIQRKIQIFRAANPKLINPHYAKKPREFKRTENKTNKKVLDLLDKTYNIPARPKAFKTKIKELAFMNIIKPNTKSPR